jgi:hypothetical protein
MIPLDVTLDTGTTLSGLVTWIGLAAFVVFCIIMGWLVPRSTYREMVHDRDIWRDAALKSEEARRDSDGQTRELLEVARATQAVVQALPRPQVPSEDSR